MVILPLYVIVANPILHSYKTCKYLGSLCYEEKKTNVLTHSFRTRMEAKNVPTTTRHSLVCKLILSPLEVGNDVQCFKNSSNVM